MNEDQIIDGILEREGGYAENPSPTNWGITLQTLAAWRKKPVTADDVKKLSVEEAKEIYRQRYILGPGLERISNPPLRSLIVDSLVQHDDEAVKWLQKALGVKVDGVFGPQTAAATEAADPRKIYLKVLAMRTRYYGRLVTNEPGRAQYAAGWNARLASFIEQGI